MGKVYEHDLPSLLEDQKQQQVAFDVMRKKNVLLDVLVFAGLSLTTAVIANVMCPPVLLPAITTYTSWPSYVPSHCPMSRLLMPGPCGPLF